MSLACANTKKVSTIKYDDNSPVSTPDMDCLINYHISCLI